MILNLGLLFHTHFLNFLQWTYYGFVPRTYKLCWRSRDPEQEGSKLSFGKTNSGTLLEELVGPKTFKKMAKNLLQDNSPWGTEEIFSSNFMPTKVRSWHKVVNWRNVWLSSAGVTICVGPEQKDVEKGTAFTLRVERKIRAPCCPGLGTRK